MALSAKTLRSSAPTFVPSSLKGSLSPSAAPFYPSALKDSSLSPSAAPFFPSTVKDSLSHNFEAPVRSIARLSTVSTACADSPKHDFSQYDTLSTDASDDEVSLAVADLTSSDSEHGDDYESPAQPCVLSVMMLLQLRSSMSEVRQPPNVRYSARYPSDILDVNVESQSNLATKTCSGASAASWRQPMEKLPEATADSWIAQQRKCTPDEDAKVVRAARSILNKLTVEKFEPLFEQLTACGIQEPHHISILMQEIFEKATIQHHFIQMYAELCVRLEKHPSITAVVQEAGELHSFRRLLLNQCQIVFEQVLEPPSEAEITEFDEEASARRKERALGNMKLIGQLLAHGMLSSDLFVQCCEELLHKRTQCPEALEALVALIMVAGPKFDIKSWQFYDRLEKLFVNMKALTKDKPTPPRLRFLIRDVLDAREAGWPHSSTPKVVEKPIVETPIVDPMIKEKVEAKVDSLLKLVGDSKRKAESRPWRAGKDDGAYWQVKTQGKSEVQVGESKSVTAVPFREPENFDVIEFRRTLAVVLNDLASDKNIPAAVQRIRMAQVPVKNQANQFADIITRVVEERRGAVRRTQLAFIAGLAAAETSAFDRKECLAGLKSFFQDIYNELCIEVLRLPSVMKSEFMPTMLNSFSKDDLNNVVPAAMRQ